MSRPGGDQLPTRAECIEAVKPVEGGSIFGTAGALERFIALHEPHTWAEKWRDDLMEALLEKGAAEREEIQLEETYFEEVRCGY